MSLGKLSCMELTSVPDRVFEALRFSYGTCYIYQIGNTYRSKMPENAFLKVTHGMQDRLFLTNFI